MNFCVLELLVGVLGRSAVRRGNCEQQFRVVTICIIDQLACNEWTETSCLLLLMVLTLSSHWSKSPHLTPSCSLIGCRQMNQFPADRQRKWVQSWPGRICQSRLLLIFYQTNQSNTIFKYSITLCRRVRIGFWNLFHVLMSGSYLPKATFHA